jgi:glycosyltransferase involved in cell wall biosynthesis
VHVAEPGVHLADLAAGTAYGGELLCVATVTFEKGHDVLVEALLSMSEQSWRCLCAGSVDRDPVFVERLRRRVLNGGLGDRVSFPGPLAAFDLDRSYAVADLMVVASRAETYGLVVTEALARALPIVATEVGGVTEALGYGADGMRPGLLVPPDDPASLAAALRAWLGDAELRGRLRRAAHERRTSLCGWSTAASVLARVLDDVLR